MVETSYQVPKLVHKAEEAPVSMMAHLPEATQAVLKEMNEEGVTQERLKHFAKTLSEIVVSVDNQDQVLAAASVIEAASTGLHHMHRQKTEFFKRIGEANPALLKYHDVKYRKPQIYS